jgi:DNA-binding NtrC family response regulator
MSISRSAQFCPSLPAPGPLVALAEEKREYEIVGSSAAMRRLRLQVRRIGPHFRTVLVRGEAGTGKELVARTLHEISQGHGVPFVLCHAAKIGDVLAERNDGVPRGTLFVDGIGEMPSAVQDRLLNFLKKNDLTQSRMETSQRADWRMIVSAVEDLKILVSTGRFRQELYHRLATVDIALPPLRERMEDLPELVRYFLDRFALLYGKSTLHIAEEAMWRMQQYHWPRNVHELERVLQEGVLQSKGRMLEAHHLPTFPEKIEVARPAIGASESARLQDIVEQHVLRVLKECRGNKLRAAEVLGISRSTLYRILDAGAPLSTVD